MTRIGVVGATGYAGAELLRILAAHPNVELVAVTSRTESGQRVDQIFPQFRGHLDLCFSEPDLDVLGRCDLVCFATPHGAAMAMVPGLLERGARILDLSADFRLRDAAVFEQWYGRPHDCPELLAEAVYGLPEMNRTQLGGARIVAAPGCYPTAVQLGLMPLLAAGVIRRDGVIADCKSGVSGAGRELKLGSLYAECSDNFKAYAASGHRHAPEITQQLIQMAAAPVELTFVPHLVPMLRGIHASIYAELSEEADVQALFESHYEHEPFVDVLPAGGHPETRSVRGTNTCRLAVHRLPGSNRLIVLSVIDNLVKGAAGQAVQCLNLMLGLDETVGLKAIAVAP